MQHDNQEFWKTKYYETAAKLKAFEVKVGLVGKLHDETVDRENAADSSKAEGVDYLYMFSSMIEAADQRREAYGLKCKIDDMFKD